MRRLGNQRDSEAGISLIEVVVSMVILSIVTAMVASLIANSLRTVARSEATSNAALIAQEQIDRLIAVPVKEWGFDSNNNLKPSITEHITWTDGLTYTVKRELDKVKSNLDIKDTCPAVVGHRVSEADMVRLTLTVSTDTGPYQDEYTTTTFITRDGNASFLKSSVTVRFEIVDGKGGKRPYDEQRDGGPIHIDVEDKFLANNGRVVTHKHAGDTKTGCITFLEIDGKSPLIQFRLNGYRLTSYDKTRYSGRVNLISGGNRELKFELQKAAQIQVVPDIQGTLREQCAVPRLIKMNTPIAAPQNRAVKSLSDIARMSQEKVSQIGAKNERDRTAADRSRLVSAQRPQYYMVCQRSKSNRSEDFSYWYLLPDTIPISEVDTKASRSDRVRPLGFWSETSFAPVPGMPWLEEGEWPILGFDSDIKSRRDHHIMVGSCLMNKSQENGAITTVSSATIASASNGSPEIVKVPMWNIPLEGWYKPKVLDPDLEGYLPLVIKNLKDSGLQDRDWGDRRIQGVYEDWYSGCQDTPVFDVGWLQGVDLDNNYMQIRMALPYGLFTYAIFAPDEQELNDQKLKVTKTRNTCYPQKRSDRYAGSRTCIVSGGPEITVFQTDVRVPYRPKLWERDPDFWGASKKYGGGYLRYFYEWTSIRRNRNPLPRGPILDACEAHTGDFRHCPLGRGKESEDDRDYTRDGYNPHDDKKPGNPGVTDPRAGGGNSGGGNSGGGRNPGGGNSGGGRNPGGGNSGGGRNPGGGQGYDPSRCWRENDYGGVEYICDEFGNPVSDEDYNDQNRRNGYYDDYDD
ncbi:type II secretion system protein [Stomatohabitans albus]|uniref:type IV pilus modification PilV family protein n=1 Tax=Stomatohabitans albus TaxID=3110766 RepID=UPI00300D420D